MASTRELILESLSRRSHSTAAELSRALGLTGANIRHHLSILVKQGSVVEFLHRPAAGRGRPARQFALARQAGSHNLDGLASALLQESVNPTADFNREDFLRALARRLAAPAVQPLGHSTLTHRLSLAVTHLNQLNYEARWEARTQAPHVIFGHCPYAAILEQHSELCQVDTYLLEAILLNPVTQAEKLKKDQTGRAFCRFIVRP